MIPVTKTFFPPIEEYKEQIQRVWDNEWLTNRGELVKELEQKLKDRLNVENIILTTNGTLPIQIALKNLAGGGEVITTPFSYVATTSAISWEGCKPVFVDIDPEHLSIDETKVEEVVTSRTTAILATHVFGNPCNIEVIKKIALKHDLKVIYDAAHCFDVKYKGRSIFNFGDISTCSFHATKLFHTAEGGALFSTDPELNQKLFRSHNFGHKGRNTFEGVGINAKMTELQAAMGLTVIPYMDFISKNRKRIVEFYDQHLDFSLIRKMRIRKDTEWNYSYYPVIFENEDILLQVQSRLQENGIFPRRYFYPSLNTLEYISGDAMPVSEEISCCILCLPLYPDLTEKEQELIVETIDATVYARAKNPI